MKHVIITCSDARYGEFLAKHWLPSLQENVSLEGIDVAVIDYGLDDNQRAYLEDNEVLIFPATPDGNITNIRYRDIARLLAQEEYDQVMAVDGGDIIFQSDIRHLFDKDKESFRGVCEERIIPFHDVILPKTDMESSDYQRIFAFLEGKQTVNGGMILGPANRFQQIWTEFQRLCKRFDVFGTDQLVINYLLYKDGFVPLDHKYNFVIMAMKSRFHIQAGKFYDDCGELIPLVHNAGMHSFTRCVGRFGYGPDKNRRKRLVPFVLHNYFRFLNLAKFLRLFPFSWRALPSSKKDNTGLAE